MRCESCAAMIVNGVFIHERGCPDAWKSETAPCYECGCRFIHTESTHQQTCQDCLDDREDCLMAASLDEEE